MTRTESVRRPSIGPGAWLGIVGLVAYGGLVGVLPYFVVPPDPALLFLVAAQALLVPVGVASFYVTTRDSPGVVSLLAIAPAIGVGPATVLITGADGLANVAGIVLAGAGIVAFSGSWAVLGYTGGTAARWRDEEWVSTRRLAVACLWVVLGSVLVWTAYFVITQFAIGLGDVA